MQDLLHLHLLIWQRPWRISASTLHLTQMPQGLKVTYKCLANDTFFIFHMSHCPNNKPSEEVSIQGNQDFHQQVYGTVHM